MSTSDVVTVDFRKYPDTPHWRFDMYRLGADEFGTWLWAPAGSQAQRGSEPSKKFKSMNVKVIVEGAWWTAIWNDAPRDRHEEELYVDIATPPEWTESSVRLIDLDLDVSRRFDGTVEVLDEDEFAEHQVTLDYPERLVDQARTTTARLFLDVRNRVEPFGEVAEHWLAMAAKLDRPAL